MIATQSPLCHKLIREVRGAFFVPSYQRGYRWDRDDVRRLLDDIWQSENKPYSLQPLVVKLRKPGVDGSPDTWELIDGQQRLTTLYLIFRYMQQEGWKRMGAPYEISYETRPGSERYLTTLNPAERDSNIDYFHLYQAYECIGEWFRSKGDAYIQEDAANKLYNYLFNSVRIIWYVVPDSGNEKDSIALFRRLNVGRIPLTDAELIKSLLLSGASTNDRAQQIAAEWDGIERDLHNPDIWAFIAGTDAHIAAEKYPTRISLLLDTLADKGKFRGSRPRYHTFETLRKEIEGDGGAKSSSFWARVVQLHALVLGWFGNPRLYNKIGFLVIAGSSFAELVHSGGSRGKKEFELWLTELIRTRIDVSKAKLSDLSYLNDYTKLRNLLLLLNVEAVSRTGQRFPFHRHLGRKWSLEHIHAQNAEKLTDKDQWKSWLQAHKQALAVLSTTPDARDLCLEIEAALPAIDSATNFGHTFQNLASRVIDVFTAQKTPGSASPGHDVHSIRNLALLSGDDNSLLNNAVFEVKRQKILEVDREGGYVPLCTRNVFLKYYTEADAQQVHFWSPQDGENYLGAIEDILAGYLKADEVGT